ncbi:hypothetical protein BU14_0058s0032 [Porphyra umbilicalis]|uniref:SnoaL-like domain-containing protein n=1 Tax=Porphyra umbilicalis TaxID=2786 RepID=A0A1X6PGY1_PORUM|nr:hypothetical protein BU14_0058s0032 [Porphyra umbilicalis]|eukprot:OSX80121.1 hypothetical protein BU14_0058s0032 [Porphyra umbilicalis]
MSSAASEAPSLPTPTPPTSIPPISAAESEAAVRHLWATFDSGAFSAAATLFTPTASYVDTLYGKPFAGIDAITGHLTAMESAFPSQFRFILDDVAPGGACAGARWHVETPGGRTVPFSRGASMYSLVREGGDVRFQEAWDFPEPTVKAAGATLLLLRGVSALVGRFPGLLK